MEVTLTSFEALSYKHRVSTLENWELSVHLGKKKVFLCVFWPVNIIPM